MPRSQVLQCWLLPKKHQLVWWLILHQLRNALIYLQGILFSDWLCTCVLQNERAQLNKYYFSATVLFVRFRYTILCYPYSLFTLIGHLHDDVTTTTTRILFFFLSSSNLVIPARFNLRPSSPIMASRAPRARVSYSVQLSRDFSRLPQMEGLLAG